MLFFWSKTKTDYIVFILSFFLITTVSASKFNGFITDNLSTPVYNKSEGKKIIAELPAGEPVKILSTNSEGWSKIQLSNRRVGWIQSQLLTSNPGNKSLNKQLTLLVEKRQNTINSKNKEINFLGNEVKELKEQNDVFKKNNFIIKTELEKLKRINKDAFQINFENQQLKRQVEFLEFDNLALKESANMKSKNTNYSWLVLISVISLVCYLVGFLIGGKKNRTKRESWNLE